MPKLIVPPSRDSAHAVRQYLNRLAPPVPQHRKRPLVVSHALRLVENERVIAQHQQLRLNNFDSWCDRSTAAVPNVRKETPPERGLLALLKIGQAAFCVLRRATKPSRPRPASIKA